MSGRAPPAVGKGDFQKFVQTGFESFRAMDGAHDFANIVEKRQRLLASARLNAVPCNRRNPVTISMIVPA